MYILIRFIKGVRKMKLRPIIPIVAALLLITGCSAQDKPNGETPPEQDITYEQTDTKGTNTVLLKTRDGMIPISHVVDGKSRLSGENYYYNLQSVIDSESSVKEKAHTYFACDGKNCGSVPYSELADNKIKAQPYEMLITSGNWRLSPSIRYEKYGKKDTVGDGYKQFIFESFPEKFSSVSEINVTDLWEYDIDGDGSNDAVIRAVGDGYTILAVQSPGLGNKILASDISGDASYTAHPFFADIDGDGGFGLITVSGNSFKTVRVYKDRTLEPDYIVYLPLEK